MGKHQGIAQLSSVNKLLLHKPYSLSTACLARLPNLNRYWLPGGYLGINCVFKGNPSVRASYTTPGELVSATLVFATQQLKPEFRNILEISVFSP
ncbi:MAG: hypothetical protein H0U45_02600 [Tatlockia sp.]|nr:hypothetical protein [Tatlockia sp.]